MNIVDYQQKLAQRGISYKNIFHDNKMPKGKSEYIHFKWRLKDRYGLKSNIKVVNEIKELILQNKAQLIRRDSNTRTIWELPITPTFTPTLLKLNPHSKVQIITIVYDSRHKVLVTAGEILKADEATRISKHKTPKRATLEDIHYGESL